jgi:hypothetical protein
MSWLLIILLVLVFLLFFLTALLLVVWVVQGTPNISASTLDLEPVETGGNGGLLLFSNAQLEGLSPRSLARMSARGVKVLAADNTGGYTVVTGLHPPSDPAPNAEDNRLVQTLYIGGRPAVTRTTTFADAAAVRTVGPVQISEAAAPREIVQWFDQNRTLPLDPNPATILNPNPKADPGDADPATLHPDRVRLKTGPEADNPAGGQGSPAGSGAAMTSAELESRLASARPTTRPLPRIAAQAVTHATLRREHLMPALAAESERRDKAVTLVRDPHRFYVTVRGRTACANSSTLQLPVQLFVPDEYAADLKALDGRLARWLVHRVHEPHGQHNQRPSRDVRETENGPRPEQTLLWQSELVALSGLVSARDELEVDTGLQCAKVGHWLMRLKLVDSTPGRPHSVLASAFFNPSSMISNGPTSFGHDLRDAWYAYRQITHAPDPHASVHQIS